MSGVRNALRVPDKLTGYNKLIKGFQMRQNSHFFTALLCMCLMYQHLNFKKINALRKLKLELSPRV